MCRSTVEFSALVREYERTRFLEDAHGLTATLAERHRAEFDRCRNDAEASRCDFQCWLNEDSLWQNPESGPTTDNLGDWLGYRVINWLTNENFITLCYHEIPTRIHSEVLYVNGGPDEMIRKFCIRIHPRNKQEVSPFTVLRLLSGHPPSRWVGLLADEIVKSYRRLYTASEGFWSPALFDPSLSSHHPQASDPEVPMREDQELERRRTYLLQEFACLPAWARNILVAYKRDGVRLVDIPELHDLIRSTAYNRLHEAEDLAARAAQRALERAAQEQ